MEKCFSINIQPQIRPVTLADGMALGRWVWTDYSAEAVEEVLGRVLEMTRHDRATGLVIASRATNEAFAYGQVTRWPRVAEISDLAVAIDQRGQGYGSALIEALSMLASRWQMTQVEIGVAVSNSRALALYRRLGFADSRQILINLGHGLEPVLYLTRGQQPATVSKPMVD